MFSEEDAISFKAVKGSPFDVKLPQRSTKDSAGYDFFAPYPFAVGVGESIVVKTWVKAKMPSNVCLLLLVRSSWGIKKGITLRNSVGLIDRTISRIRIMTEISCLPIQTMEINHWK